MTKYWQVASKCKTNCTVGTSHEGSKSLLGKCTATSRRLCVFVKCISAQSHVSFFRILGNFCPFHFAVRGVVVNKITSRKLSHLCCLTKLFYSRGHSANEQEIIF